MKVVFGIRLFLVAPRTEEEEPGRAQEKCLISVQAVISFVARGLGFTWVDGLTFVLVKVSKGLYVVGSSSAQTAPAVTPQWVPNCHNHLTCPYVDLSLHP